MTMTRNLQRMKPATHPRRVWLLAMGLALTPIFSAASWADNYNLQSVDFATVGDKTNIILHTGSIVPVEKVLVSDNKLILDIDQVNTDDTVHTNFAGAGNISHVIMQPLNDHKIRMIIRGEGLGVPSVAFYNAGNGSYNNVNPDFEGSKLATQTSTALHKMQDEGTKPATFQGFTDSDSSASPAEKPVADTTRPQVVDTTKPKDDGSDGFSGFIAPEGKSEATATTPAPTGKPALKAASETAPIPLQSNDAGGTASDFFSQLLTQLAHGKFNGMLGLGLLGIALLGGGFTCYKLVQLKQGPPDLEDLIEEQAQGKRISFREMASAYRSKHEPLERAPKTGNRKTNAEDVIGLRSLNHVDEPVDAGAAFVPPLPQASPGPSKSTASSLEQMIAAIQSANAQKKPVNTPAPKKQAVNQYLQNQQAAKPKPKNRQPADEMMIREQKRAQAAQQELLQQTQQQAKRQQHASAPLSKLPGSAPVNRAAAAQKQVKSPNFQSVPSSKVGKAAVHPAAKPNAAQGPLPGNPEVLNFLRNVADLMEKDGKGEIAKSIHKNLNPKNAGLV